jgi:hypothetical protein
MKVHGHGGGKPRTNFGHPTYTSHYLTVPSHSSGSINRRSENFSSISRSGN